MAVNASSTTHTLHRMRESSTIGNSAELNVPRSNCSMLLIPSPMPLTMPSHASPRCARLVRSSRNPSNSDQVPMPR